MLSCTLESRTFKSVHFFHRKAHVEHSVVDCDPLPLHQRKLDTSALTSELSILK